MRHPVFGSRIGKGVSFADSVYYLWWEFLRRHEGYRRTSESGGEGDYAALYRDFGDVHATDFRTWWTKDERGARLFAEPAVPVSVVLLKPGDIGAILPNWESGELIVVGIPLGLPKEHITQRIGALLKQHHKRRRGERTLKESRALYPVTGQVNVASLKKALRVYDLKKANPETPDWRIGQEVGLGDLLTAQELSVPRGKSTATIRDKRNKLAIATSRKRRMAEAIIEGVGRGRFPVYAWAGARVVFPREN